MLPGGVLMLKILIAEDDRELRQLFSHVLTKHGYTVNGVSDGQQALDAMDSDYFDLLICDIMMPVMDGIEALKLIKGDENAKVIMITAAGQKEKMMEALKYGAEDFLTKPFDEEEVIKRVAKAEAE